MTEPMQQRAWRPIDVLLICVATLVVVLFIAAGLLLYFEKMRQASALATVESKISLLKLRGAPIDAASLNSLYQSRTSPADTAAWIRVLERLKSDDFKRQYAGIYPLGTKKKPATPAERESHRNLCRTLIEQNADLFSDIHNLTSHAQAVRFGDGGWNESQSTLVDFRQLMRLLMCEASVHIGDRNSPALYRCLKSEIDAVSIVKGRDLVVDHLIISAILSSMISDVRDSQEQNTLEVDELNQLLEDLKKLPGSVQNWHQIVEYERAWILPYLRGHATFDQSSSAVDDGDVSNTSSIDLLNYLSYMERFETINWSSWKTVKESFKLIEDELDKDIASATFWNRHNWHSTSIAMTSWSMVAEALVRNVSDRNQAILACAARLYKIKHGTFPDRLDQLVDVGIDPTQYLTLADQPFGYELKDDTAYLWGPIKDEHYHYQLEISPNIPHASANATPQQRDRIDEALWTLSP